MSQSNATTTTSVTTAILDGTRTAVDSQYAAQRAKDMHETQKKKEEDSILRKRKIEECNTLYKVYEDLRYNKGFVNVDEVREKTKNFVLEDIFEWEKDRLQRLISKVIDEKPDILEFTKEEEYLKKAIENMKKEG